MSFLSPRHKSIYSRLYAVSSLSLSLAVGLLLLWITAFEYCYDSYHSNAQRIYRVTMHVQTDDSDDHYATTGALLGENLLEYADVEASVSFRIPDVSGSITMPEQVYDNVKLFGVGKEIFKVFSLSRQRFNTSIDCVRNGRHWVLMNLFSTNFWIPIFNSSIPQSSDFFRCLS